MATYAITIKDNTSTTKHLLGLIMEKAKTENTNILIEPIPNDETVKALEDVKKGNVIKTNSKKDFFSKLNS